MMKSTGGLLKKLRVLMKNLNYVSDPLSAYIVTSCDAHINEYLAECDKRRDFISGFTGSAGTAIITENEALMWTDGRYFLQASQEMDENWTLMKEGVPSTPSQESWLTKNLPDGSRVGVDPRYIQYNKYAVLKADLESAGMSLVPVTTNLIDLIWSDRPDPPCAIVQPLSIQYSGKSSREKVNEVRSIMEKEKASALILTALDEIAWLLNLRGSDIEYNPVFFSYVILTLKQVHLFIDESKITPAVKNHFKSEELAIIIHPYEKIEAYLTDLVAKEEGRFWLSHTSNYHLHSIIPEKRRICTISPVQLMKAVKNKTEIKGMIDCHIRDAAALCIYFAWLEKTITKETVTEVSGADKLEEIRSQFQDYVGLSFPTISSSGPNGAITHYRPVKGADRRITTEELYLCDSGAQFRDGTTDVTRTMHFGTPSDFEKDCFTRVLKGQIYLGTSIFPNKIKGNSLDSRARRFLWDVGLDYLHGTGHGIGSYLNVHEGPIGISWRHYPDDPGLEEGMFLSNEPGYYEDGKFGIRLENIVRIVPAKTPHNHKNRGFLTFESVTLVPIQTKMLVPSMLTEQEIAYLNEYHNECREKVGPLLKEMGAKEGLEWLYRETEPIG